MDNDVRPKIVVLYATEFGVKKTILADAGQICINRGESIDQIK